MLRTFTLVIFWYFIIGGFGFSPSAYAQSPEVPLSSPPDLQSISGDSGLLLGTLRNGMDILLIPDTSLPVATIEVTVRTGAFTEDDASDGINHLFEHMVFRSSQHFPEAGDFGHRSGRLGIVRYAETGQEASTYRFHLGKDSLLPGLALMYEGLRFPNFENGEMATALRDVAGRLESLEAQPIYYLADELAKTLWKENFSRKNVYGPFFKAREYNKVRLEALHKTWYYPENMLLGIGGDIDPVQAYAWADSLFGSWPQTQQKAFEKLPIPTIQPLDSAVFFTSLNEYADYPVVLVGWQGPDTENDMKGVFAADLFNTLLASRASRFSKALSQSGLAIHAEWTTPISRSTSPIVLNMVPDPERIEEALGVLTQQLELMDQEGYFTEDELERAKAKLGYREAYDMEKATDLLHKLGLWWSGPGIIHGVHYKVAMEGVTLDDLQEYVQRYLKGRPFVAGFLANSEIEASINFREAWLNPDTTLANTEPFPLATAVKSTASQLPESNPPRRASTINPDTDPNLDVSPDLGLVPDPIPPPEPQPGPRVTIDSVPEIQPIPTPAAPTASLTLLKQQVKTYRIYFKLGSDTPDAPSMQEIREMATLMASNPELRIHINGYTDGDGDGVTNYQLSLRRAGAIKDLMIRQFGISEERLEVVGWGEAFPEFEETSAQNKAKNRRVTFDVIEERKETGI